MPSSHLYFIAVLAPEPIASQVKDWKIWMREHFQCKAALKSPAHITLVPPFKMDQSKESLLINLLDRFSIGTGCFEVQLKNFGHFGQRVLFVNVQDNPGLQRLQQDLMRFIEAERFDEIEPEDRPFHPHVTIATRDLERRDFPLAKEHFDKLSYEANFMASALVLLRNTPGRWDVIHESPLLQSDTNI